jgi:hypothetical protein
LIAKADILKSEYIQNGGGGLSDKPRAAEGSVTDEEIRVS